MRLLTLLLACWLAGIPLPGRADGLTGPALAAALRSGGLVLYFRHTATDFSKNDSGMRGFEDCDNQRPLTDGGRRDAVAIGAAMRALGVVVSEAHASPFCRTREHARLMLPGVNLRDWLPGDRERLRSLFSTPPEGRGVRVIVGHGNPYRDVVGGSYLAEGEAAVLRPGGSAGWSVVARIGVADWAALPGPR